MQLRLHRKFIVCNLMGEEFTLFPLAIKNLKRKPLRTGILIVAIGLLVSTIVFAISFIRHVDLGIKITSDRLGADLLIVPTGSRGPAEDVLLENKIKSFYMDKEIVEKVKNIKGIGDVTYQTYLTTLPGLCCDVPETLVIAFDQETDFIVEPWLKKKLGRMLKKNEAIVGSNSAFNIEIGLVDVDSVIFGNIFRMVAVLDKTGTGLDNAIFIDDKNIDNIIKTGKANIKPGQTSIIFAKVKKGYDPYEIMAEIEDSIIEVDVITRKDIGKNILSALNDIKQVFFITVFLASLFSIFLTWSIFSAIANERAKEVGIMRAIGAKESHIVGLFSLEVLVIGGIGSIIGAIFGMTIYLLLTKNFTIVKNLSIEIGIIEPILIGIVSVLFGIVICIIGALSPIQRIKKLEPLLAIKGE